MNDANVFHMDPNKLAKNRTYVKWDDDTLYFNDGNDNFIDITTIVSRIKKLEDEIRELQK